MGGDWPLKASGGLLMQGKDLEMRQLFLPSLCNTRLFLACLAGKSEKSLSCLFSLGSDVWPTVAMV